MATYPIEGIMKNETVFKHRGCIVIISDIKDVKQPNMHSSKEVVGKYQRDLKSYSENFTKGCAEVGEESYYRT